MGLLTGKTVLITGVISPASIAYGVAGVALAEGARLVVTSFGRPSLVQRLTCRLSPEIPVVELDVTDTEQLNSLADRVGAHVGRIDGVVHAVAYAPPTALGDAFSRTPWEDVATTVRVSTYSLQALTVASLPLMPSGGSVVGLDFDASVAWSGYGWMGVAKAGLESCARHLARELAPRGIRVNLVAAGPLRTLAAGAIPAPGEGGRSGAPFDQRWAAAAPLGWDPCDAGPVARTVVALLSDWLPATTGETLHADGGAHAADPYCPVRAVEVR